MANNGGLTLMLQVTKKCRNRHCNAFSAHADGFSLIEVMVALVILVIGLIGIFNLHIVAKRSSFESFQQTQASYFANDIINRMRLNTGVLGSYSGTYTGVLAKPAKSCLGAALCTPAETAAWDLYQWEQSLIGAAEVVGSQKVGGLDSPTVCITTSNLVLGGKTYTNASVKLVVAWRGIREMADATKTGDCGAGLTKRRRSLNINTVII
jgi:type IV pilus assembly protein PilV